MPNKEGRWVTINGRAIFIGEGQSLEEAMNSKGQVKKAAGGSQGSSSSKTEASAAKPSRSAAKKAIAKKAEQVETDMTEWTDDEKLPVFDYYYNKEFTADEAEYDITENINEDILFDYDGYFAYAKKMNKKLGRNVVM